MQACNNERLGVAVRTAGEESEGVVVLTIQGHRGSLVTPRDEPISKRLDYLKMEALREGK